MKKPIFLSLVVLALAALPILAQTNRAVVNIPFSFILEGKTFSAGHYEVMEGSNPRVLLVRNLDTRHSAFAPVLTRIQSRGQADSELVFDVTEGQHYLSEIYLAGMDGYLVQGAPGQHTHVAVKGKA